MLEITEAAAGGLGSLILGMFFLINYKSMSRHGAEQSKEWGILFKFDYSEQFFRSLYVFIGAFLSLVGMVVILNAFIGVAIK